MCFCLLNASCPFYIQGCYGVIKGKMLSLTPSITGVIVTATFLQVRPFISLHCICLQGYTYMYLFLIVARFKTISRIQIINKKSEECMNIFV